MQQTIQQKPQHSSQPAKCAEPVLSPKESKDNIPTSKSDVIQELKAEW